MTRNTWQGQVWLVVVEWGLRPTTPTIAVPDGEESAVEAFLDFFCEAAEYTHEWSKETHGDESTTYTIVLDSGDEPTVVARFRSVRPANQPTECETEIQEWGGGAQ